MLSKRYRLYYKVFRIGQQGNLHPVSQLATKLIYSYHFARPNKRMVDATGRKQQGPFTAFETLRQAQNYMRSIERCPAQEHADQLVMFMVAGKRSKCNAPWLRDRDGDRKLRINYMLDGTVLLDKFIIIVDK